MVKAGNMMMKKMLMFMNTGPMTQSVRFMRSMPQLCWLWAYSRVWS